MQHFARELARYWRNLLVAKISGQATRLIAASDQNRSTPETAAAFSEEDLTRYLHLTLDFYKSLQTSLQPRLHLELGLVKLVQAGRLRSIEDALSGLPQASVASAPPAPKASAPAPPQRARRPVVRPHGKSETGPVPGPLERNSTSAPMRLSKPRWRYKAPSLC